MEIFKQTLNLIWGLSMIFIIISVILFGAFRLAEYLNKDDESKKNNRGGEPD